MSVTVKLIDFVQPSRQQRVSQWWQYFSANHTLGIQRSHDRWHHVTRKVKVVTPVTQYLWGSIAQLLCEVDGGFKLNT